LNRLLLFTCTLAVCAAMPTTAAVLHSTAISHMNPVYQAYPGCSTGANMCSAGYNTLCNGVISAYPGVLCITPGGADWPNYVAAAYHGVDYTVKNTMLIKETPEFVQCASVFPPHKIVQQGTPNIRLWWPLMYELPKTTYKLVILYGTPELFDDDGVGTNPPSWVHVEEWTWKVDASFDTMRCVIQLFHQLPFGKDQVPLISDEELYSAMLATLAAAKAAYEANDPAAASQHLADLELDIMDGCIPLSPQLPAPTGPGTGIANTNENPACCKLLVDIEYILETTGIGKQRD